MKAQPKTMRVLYVEPGKYPCAKEIPATLEAMQEAVGGLIEITCPWPDSPAVLVCNEEGKLDGLPRNRYLPDINDILHGSFFVCDGSGENLQSLSDGDMEKYAEILHSPEFFWRQFGTLFIYKCTPNEYQKLMNRQR